MLQSQAKPKQSDISNIKPFAFPNSDLNFLNKEHSEFNRKLNYNINFTDRDNKFYYSREGVKPGRWSSWKYTKRKKQKRDKKAQPQTK